MRRWILLLWVWSITSFGPALGQLIDASVLPTPDPWRYVPLQRVRALLARSTRENPVPIRILIYGQSITQQEWWIYTTNVLQKAFPEANLVVANRAIGSFDASFLIKTAEIDVYSFRPDLIIYHSYGPYGIGRQWEQILRAFRARTTADIILIGNHPLYERDLAEPTDPDLIPVPSEAWLNYLVCESLSRELGLCFPDNRTAWKHYVTAKKVPLSSLLLDGWHFNLAGSELQTAILRPFLEAPPVMPAIDPLNNGRVNTWPVGHPAVKWEGNRLRFAFVGNRVDALERVGTPRRCQVRIDGKVPTSLPSGRGHRRVPLWMGESYPWPALLQVGAIAPLALETWAIRVSRINPTNAHDFEFELSGSVTGPDGVGTSTNLFVSRSGRVRIAPDDWNPRLPAGVSQLGVYLIWNTENRAVDEYRPGSSPVRKGESVTTLVNDLPDGPHVLELIADEGSEPVPLEALRVYHPAGSVWTNPETDTPQLRVLNTAQGVLAIWPAEAGEHQLILRSELGSSGSPSGEDAEVRYGVRGKRISTEESQGFLQLEKR